MGAVCDEDADCAGALCDGPSRCVEGRCQPGDPPDCFDGATCVLAAGLPLASCPEAPPANLTRLFERAYVLVLGAEAAAPDSLKRAKRRLKAATKQLTRAGKLVQQMGGKNRLAASCAGDLTATIARALERTSSFRTNLATCVE